MSFYVALVFVNELMSDSSLEPYVVATFEVARFPGIALPFEALAISKQVKMQYIACETMPNQVSKYEKWGRVCSMTN